MTKSAAKPAFVRYATVEKVSVPFNIQASGEEIRGVWMERGGRVAFDVPTELEASFAKHWHVQVGNVKKIEDAPAEKKAES